MSWIEKNETYVHELHGDNSLDNNICGFYFLMICFSQKADLHVLK